MSHKRIPLSHAISKVINAIPYKTLYPMPPLKPHYFFQSFVTSSINLCESTDNPSPSLNRRLCRYVFSAVINCPNSAFPPNKGSKTVISKSRPSFPSLVLLAMEKRERKDPPHSRALSKLRTGTRLCCAPPMRTIIKPATNGGEQVSWKGTKAGLESTGI